VQEDLELVVEEKPQPGGFSIATGVSLVFHAALIILFITTYRGTPAEQPESPITRYVELIRQQPREFTEAPGPEVQSAPMTAPYSDANRRASTPNPTGDKPTKRPGDGEGLFQPPMGSGGGPAQQQEQQQAAAMQPETSRDSNTEALDVNPDRGSSRIPALRSQEANAAAGVVDWRSVVRDVKQVASLGGDQGVDLGRIGGEKGTADTGPLSFETQWYDWGDYAQSMVSKIRVHWYEHMPMLIRTGMKGVVTIRFTIHRDGRITDITLLDSSDIPPYDFAAKKAIELASPLNPLPKDFPNSKERVTAMFYYNSSPPRP
jgi:TonB family protein